MGKFNAQSKEALGNAFKSGNLGGTIGSIGSGISGVLSSSLANAEIADTSAEENEIKDTANTQFNYDDYDSLLSSYNPFAIGKTDYSRGDVRGLSGGQMALNTGKGMLSGAAAGAQVGGPWGAVAGAAVGLAGGIAGIFAGNNKADAKAAELNLESTKANQAYLQNFSNNASNISQNMFNSAALNLAAFGGLLDSLDTYTKYKLKSFAYGGNLKPKSKMRYSGFGNYFAYGGDLNMSGDWSNGVTIVKEGGSHEANPIGGVPFGVDREGVPNLVEEGEVIFNDYVFSNRLSPSIEQLKEIYLPKKFKGKTYSDIAKIIQKESSETPNDPISQNSLIDGLSKLTVLQEDSKSKSKEAQKQEGNKFGFGDFLGEAARYAPVVGSAIQSISDAFGWTNKPDYTNSNIIRNAARNVRNVSAKPVGNYLTYNPFDTNYEQTKLANIGIGTQRNLLNTTSGNRGAAMAGLLSLNNSISGNMGDLYRKSLDYNNAQRQQVAQFNTSIDQFNSQQSLKAAESNQDADIYKMYVSEKEAALRDQIESTSSQARSANLSNLWSNLGALGTDQFNQNQAWDFIKAQGLEDQYKTFMKKRAKGGKIRRGLTF